MGEGAKWIDNATKNWDVFLLDIIRAMAISEDISAFLTTFDQQKNKWGNLPIHKSKKTYETVPQQMGMQLQEDPDVDTLLERGVGYGDPLYQVADDQVNMIKIAIECLKRGFFCIKMNWYKNIKLASVQYMYHGTGIQNLNSVLSEGLNSQHNLLYDEDLDFGSIRSYGGVYLTDNLMTAARSASQSNEKFDNKSGQLLIIMTQIETRTPHILLDEDKFPEPGVSINKSLSFLSSASNAEMLAYFFVNELPQKIDDIATQYLEDISEQNDIQDWKFLNNLRSYIIPAIRAYVVRLLANRIDREQKGEYAYGLGDASGFESFFEQYPQFRDLTMQGAEQEWRNANDNLIHKAHRWVDLTDSFGIKGRTNVRSMESITYRGKNKIVLVAVMKKNQLNSQYYMEVDIIYMIDDNNAIDKLIIDIQDRYSQDLIIKYKDQIIYDNPNEEI